MRCKEKHAYGPKCLWWGRGMIRLFSTTSAGLSLISPTEGIQANSHRLVALTLKHRPTYLKLTSQEIPQPRAPHGLVSSDDHFSSCTYQVPKVGNPLSWQGSILDETEGIILDHADHRQTCFYEKFLSMPCTTLGYRFAKHWCDSERPKVGHSCKGWTCLCILSVQRIPCAFTNMTRWYESLHQITKKLVKVMILWSLLILLTTLIL